MSACAVESVDHSLLVEMSCAKHFEAAGVFESCFHSLKINIRV